LPGKEIVIDFSRGSTLIAMMRTSLTRRNLGGLTHPKITPQRLDCLAGLRGLELENACQSHVFEIA
jgi:hypothetical protein